MPRKITRSRHIRIDRLRFFLILCAGACLKETSALGGVGPPKSRLVAALDQFSLTLWMLSAFRFGPPDLNALDHFFSKHLSQRSTTKSNPETAGAYALECFTPWNASCFKGSAYTFWPGGVGKWWIGIPFRLLCSAWPFLAHDGLKVHLKKDCEGSASQRNALELISFFGGSGCTAHRSCARCTVVLLLQIRVRRVSYILPMHRSEQTIALQVHYVVLRLHTHTHT